MGTDAEVLSCCREFHKERKKREEERKKSVSCLAKKSPKGVHQTTEQRNYQLKVREMRSKWKGSAGDGNESDSSSELQGNEKDRSATAVDEPNAGLRFEAVHGGPGDRQ